MAAPESTSFSLIRPTYGLEFRVSAQQPSAGRIEVTISVPARVGAFAPSTDPIIIHSAYYDLNPTTLFNPSFFAYWGWLPIGTVVTVTSNPAAENAVIASALCPHVDVVGPGYDSRWSDAINLSRSTIVSGTEDDTTAILVQTHQFDYVNVGIHNPGDGAAVVTLSDAESGRVIATATVATLDDDTVVLTEELPDVLEISIANASTDLPAVITIRGVCL